MGHINIINWNVRGINCQIKCTRILEFLQPGVDRANSREISHKEMRIVSRTGA